MMITRAIISVKKEADIVRNFVVIKKGVLTIKKVSYFLNNMFEFFFKSFS